MDTVKSTNNWLSSFFYDIDDGALAIQQTEGKGRRGNVWTSKTGGLYFSFISSNHRLLPLITGISVVESLVDIKDDIKLKWPNDIIVKEKKLGGILCENHGDYTVVGIGLNISNDISLSDAINLSDLNYNLDRLDFVSFFKFNFNNIFNLSPQEILEKYTELDFLIGRKIDWNTGSGIVQSVDIDGSLVVSIEDKIVNLYSEEISIEKY
ncbi:MAG: biotin--[acetyl-CoA-carboxylase] ligase [archaeon]|nr:biotin--[acetyl-CoA-carboxylase] ligase [archaeon]